jgi:hypothetical protein
MFQFTGNNPKIQSQSFRNKLGGDQQEETQKGESVRSCKRTGSSLEWKSLQGKINRWTWKLDATH